MDWMRYMPAREKAALALAVCVACAATAAPIHAAAANAASSVAYLKAQQVAGGGFAEPGASADVTTTSWALIGAAAAGEDPLSWKVAGAGALPYLESEAESLVNLEDIELCALALAAAGGDPRDLSGRDLLSVVRAERRRDGRIGETLAETCWGMVALLAAGEKPGGPTVDWVLEKQRRDGAWGDSDAEAVRDTALAVLALASAENAYGRQVAEAMKALRSRLGDDGGYSYAGGPSNTELTSLVTCALSAAGQDPSGSGWLENGKGPVSFLDSMQAADGHYLFAKKKESQPVVMTSMALSALAGKGLLSGRETASRPEGNAVRDQGTVGAGMRAGSVPGVPRGPGAPGATGWRSTSRGSASGRPGGLWAFVVLCLAYALMLAAAASAAALYLPRGTVRGGSAGPGE